MLNLWRNLPNERRKDLTDYERSKVMLKRAETVAEVLREQPEYLSNSDKNSRGRGQPPKPDSQQRIAEHMGTTQPRISEAQAYVSTADTFP